MEYVYLGILIFIFCLAIFDLIVGVSNDAVNFLNSAVGAKTASFKVILLLAAIGVFFGAATSNGMMDVARHGIFQPQYFTFVEIMCILMAVMVTDVILLDTFNSLGMQFLFTNIYIFLQITNIFNLLFSCNSSTFIIFVLSAKQSQRNQTI